MRSGEGHACLHRNVSAMRTLRLALPLAALFLIPTASAQGAETTGTVLAAGKPVNGAKVELFQAGTTGAKKLTSVTAGEDGTFLLSYTPDPASGPLYAVSGGGKVGKRKLPREARFMAILDDDNAPSSNVFLNEQTTVAAVYATAQFLHGKAIYGPSPGLANAMANAANLYEARAGKLSFVLASAPNGNATDTLPKFNTLANVLVRCSLGGRVGCRSIFAFLRAPGMRRPRNTIEAVHQVALFPGERVKDVYLMQGGIKTYAPLLERVPDSWVMAIVHTGAGMNAPGRMAFDAAGNVWVINNFEYPGTTAGRELTVLDPTGRPIYGSPIRGGGLAGAGWGVAIAQDGEVWVGNFGGSGISLFGPEGEVLSPPCGPGGAPPCGYTQGGISKPQGMAIDQNGNLWIANFGADSVTVYLGGDPDNFKVITGGGIFNPFGIAIDSTGAAWVTNGAESGRGSVTKINPDFSIDPISPIKGGGLRSPQGISVDQGDNLWVGNLATKSVTQIRPDGTISKRSPIKTKNMGGTWGTAVDGDGNVWVAGFLNTRITQLCGLRVKTCPPGLKTGEPISPKTGYTSKGLQHLTAIEVDASGNVWAANNWSQGSPVKDFVGGNGVVELIGAAAPVAAPRIGPPVSP